MLLDRKTLFTIGLGSTVLAALVGISLSQSGCVQAYCLPSWDPGVNVYVYDANSGLPNACGVTAVFTEGEFTEEITLPEENCDPNTAALEPALYERPGTYSITLSKAGYHDWHIDDFVLEIDSYGCHVLTRQLDVFMDSDI